MHTTAVYKNEWYSAGAGLVDVRAASSHPAKSFVKAYLGDNQVTDVLDEKRTISNVFTQGTELSVGRMTYELKDLLIHSQSPKVRAAILINLANSSEITDNIMKIMLDDPNSHVKMAALFVLHHREDIRKRFLNKVIELFEDHDINIRFCAIKLASAIGDASFLKPLISGLLDDALQQLVSTFGARCEGLHLLTGTVYEPEPEFGDGQCFYSELSTESRISIAKKWERYALTH